MLGDRLIVASTTWEEVSKLVEETLEKDLGVWISADMKCSQQCRYAVNKANKILGMIKRTVTYKDLKIMLNLYG